MPNTITASAPAKIILFGEHAVVYGVPAIAIPVPALRASVTARPTPGQGLRVDAIDSGRSIPVDLESVVEDALAETARLVLDHLHITPYPELTLELRSTIPMASGLGSGAAVSAALARALALAVGHPLHDDDLNAIVYEIEKGHHGTPSGIDNTVVVYERPVYFVRGEPIQPLSFGSPFHFLIADTGQPSLTKPAVADVRALYDIRPAFAQRLLDEIRAIVLEARTALEQGDAAVLGPLMTANHALLQSLSVSSPALDTLVHAALDAGALGAKLSGGGRGGNMIVLTPTADSAAVEDALLQAGAVRVVPITVG